MMRLKTTLSTLLALWAFLAVGQTTFNMPFQGADTTSVCNGTLYDHGGPTGYYSNSAHGYFYLDLPGNSLSLTFTSFNLEGCCDYVRVYDGIGTSGTLLVSANGTALPNGGNAINVPSGKATIRFTSDGSVTRPGFAMTWSGGGTTAPVANFSVGNSNPPVNVPVSFTNTSSSSGSYLWDFGDGTSSTDEDLAHVYKSPGVYSVTLTASNCYGSDVSNSQNVTVMSSPVFTVSPDSLYQSVSCGANVNTSFTISHTSGGTMNYDIESKEAGTLPYLFQESFETGLGKFSLSSNAYAAFNPSVVLGGAAEGNGALQLAGYTSNYTGLSGSFTSDQPTAFSYYIKPANSYYHGNVALGNSLDNNPNDHLLWARIYYGALEVVTGGGYYSHALSVNQWNQIEVKNIDWTAKTYDLYIDDVQVATGYSFYDNTLTSVNQVHIWNGNNATCGIDEVLVEGPVASPLSIAPQSGILSSGNSNTIGVSVPTAGKTAGTYYYDIIVNNNSTGNDSNFTIPLVVDVVGSPQVNFDKTCVNYGNLFSSLTATDSVMVHNSGCDTLDITSITSTSSDFSTDAASLQIPPYDTTYLLVNFDPSVVAAYTDTLHFFTNNGDTSICLNANSLGAPSVATDSAAYTLTSIGCNDSIPFSFEIINDGQSVLTWDVHTSQAYNVDDFENGFNSSIWQSHGSNTISSSCFVNSGSHTLFFTGSNRYAQTNASPVMQGDSLRFWIAPGTSGSGCEPPDFGESLYLEYSTNGSTWNPIQTFTPSQPHGFVSIPVPTGAISATTSFRFRQTTYSVVGGDNYLVDDFAVGSFSSGTFSPGNGSTAAGDTITVSGYLQTTGLSTGSYQRWINILTNDPADTVHQVDVTINVVGEPNLITEQGCVDFGTVMSGTTVSDTTIIWNNGCDDLTVSGNNSTNPDFSVSITPSILAPGDSAEVVIDFSPTTVGAYQDSIFISSNDTTAFVCLQAQAVGAPNATVDPDSIHVSFTSCGDSIIVPLTLKNLGGLSPLDFEIGGDDDGEVNITTVTNGKYSSEYNNLKQVLLSIPDVTLNETNTTSPTVFQAQLSNTDILIVPALMGTSTMSALASEIQAFTNNGGKVICILNSTSNHQIMNLMPFTSNGTFYSPATNEAPNHPIMAGLPAAMPYYTVFQMEYTGNNYMILASGSSSNHAVVALHTYGSGEVVYIGYNYSSLNTDIELLMENAVGYLSSGSLPDYLEVAPDSGSVAVDDSVTIDVKVSSSDLRNGTYNSGIVINTNDPANPEITVPVHVIVNGAPQLTMVNNSGCTSFTGVQQGATATEEVWLYNSGCDTLDLTGFNAATADFGIANVPQSVAPGDSLALEVTFSPTSVGSFSDTLQVLNNDTTAFICVDGTSVGAPVLGLSTDTLRVQLNKCRVIKNVNFRLDNTGQGPMNYGINFGGYTGSSQIPFSTTSATTSHVFNGVPPSDTLEVRVILHGDFGDYYERAQLYIDGSYRGYVYDNNVPDYVNDTLEYVYYGTTVQNWTSDGQLTVDLNNSYDVTGGPGSFHRVEVKLSSQVNWVSVIGSTSGTVSQGGHANKNMLFNAASLTLGTYYTNMNIVTNAPGSPNAVVPVELEVISEPEIAVSDTCLNYSQTMVGDTSSMDLWLYNTGCQPLNISNILSTNNDFKLSASSGMIGVEDSMKVRVDFVPTGINNYSASLLINNNDTDQVICLNASSNMAPIADFEYSYENQCLGEVIFNDKSLHGSNVLWNFGDGNTSSQSNPTHYYKKAGTYTVLLRVDNSAGYDTITQNVTVAPLYVDFAMSPDDTIAPNTTVNFYDSSAVPISWDWNFGDGNTSTSQDPSNTYSNLGKYQVTLEVSDSAGCTRTETKNLWVVDEFAVEEHTLDGKAYQMYPNPSEGIVYLESAEIAWSLYEMSVIDATGRLVRKFRASENTPTVQIDLTGVAPGVYQLVISNISTGSMKGRESVIIH